MYYSSSTWTHHLQNIFWWFNLFNKQFQEHETLKWECGYCRWKRKCVCAVCAAASSPSPPSSSSPSSSPVRATRDTSSLIQTSNLWVLIFIFIKFFVYSQSYSETSVSPPQPTSHFSPFHFYLFLSIWELFVPCKFWIEELNSFCNLQFNLFKFKFCIKRTEKFKSAVMNNWNNDMM